MSCSARHHGGVHARHLSAAWRPQAARKAAVSTTPIPAAAPWTEHVVVLHTRNDTAYGLRADGRCGRREARTSPLDRTTHLVRQNKSTSFASFPQKVLSGCESIRARQRKTESLLRNGSCLLGSLIGEAVEALGGGGVQLQAALHDSLHRVVHSCRRGLQSLQHAQSCAALPRLPAGSRLHAGSRLQVLLSSEVAQRQMPLPRGPPRHTLPLHLENEHKHFALYDSHPDIRLGCWQAARPSSGGVPCGVPGCHTLLR